jgi:hypothetical protein
MLGRIGTPRKDKFFDYEPERGKKLLAGEVRPGAEVIVNNDFRRVRRRG